MAEVASAYVSLIPSARGFAAGVTRETDKAATTAGKSFGGKFAGSVRGILGPALAGIGVTKLISDSLSEAREAQKVGALTTQVIKSTGGAANVTAKQVGNLATAISNKVGVDDEAIQSGLNMLLTFKNIRNEAGAGNKVFNQAAASMTDLAAGLAAASGGELNFRTASIQVGRALNDPVKGVTALSRAGVQFNDQQKKQIKTLVESGNIMGAQKVILKELKSEFGGAAAAQATAGDKARVAWKNLEEQIGTALLPVVDDLANRLTKDVVPAVSEFISQMQDGTGAGGELAGELKSIYNTGKGVVSFFNDLPGPVKKFAIEGGIALVVLSKMRGLFGPSATAINGFVSGMANAETRMDTTAKASRRLGSGIQTLAGAGGLLALQDGAKKTDSVVGALETTLGSAAAGFAVGGPIGAAVGGLGGLTYSLWRATKKSWHEAKISLPSWKEYAGTLDGVTASTTKSTKAMVYNRLEKSGLLDATRKLGLTDRQAIQAMTGDEAQRKRLSDALRNQNVLTKAQEDALRKETGSIGASRLAQLKKNVALADNREELRKARTALRNFMAEPASKQVAITGVEDVKAQIRSLRKAIRSVWGQGKDLNTPGPGGIDLLLRPGLRAMGGPVLAGQPYIVGENRPELFVPNQSGRIIPRVPKVTPGQVAGAAPAGPLVNIERLTPANYSEFMTEVDKRARLAGLDGSRPAGAR